jgi:hypothetical protein
VSYLDALAKKWRANMRGRARSSLARPNGLRGRDFVGELMRLHVLTGDRRFNDALTALINHGIIDEKFNFRRWRAPELAKHEAEVDRIALDGVRFLIDLGKPKKRACAEIAAALGLEAVSFAAAIRQLELRFASTTKKSAA